jgi:hypothetical protein
MGERIISHHSGGQQGVDMGRASGRSPQIMRLAGCP